MYNTRVSAHTHNLFAPSSILCSLPRSPPLLVLSSATSPAAALPTRANVAAFGCSTAGMELRYVSVVSAATIKWAQRNHKRYGGRQAVFRHASRLLPLHGNVMTLWAHDTESARQIFMRDILFFHYAHAQSSVEIYRPSLHPLFSPICPCPPWSPNTFAEKSCFCVGVLFAHYHSDMEVVHF